MNDEERALRDFIATAAMNALMRSYAQVNNEVPGDQGSRSFIATRAYAMADAMIEARNAASTEGATT